MPSKAEVWAQTHRETKSACPKIVAGLVQAAVTGDAGVYIVSNRGGILSSTAELTREEALAIADWIVDVYREIP